MDGMTSTLQLTLGETLRLMRERAGFSQSQLAGYLEIGRTSVIRYEADVAAPKWKDVDAWARICDHDPQIVRELWVAARESGCIHDHDGRYSQLSWAGAYHGSGDPIIIEPSGAAA